MSPWLWLFLGFAIGGFIGVGAMALAVAAGKRVPEPTHPSLEDREGGTW